MYNVIRNFIQFNGASVFNFYLAYFSFFLVDDQLIIEPDIGSRQDDSKAIADEGAQLALGTEATNWEKDAVEGQYMLEQIVWGILYILKPPFRVALPPAKLEKA